MILEYEQQKTVDTIEETVVKYFEVEPQDIVNKRGSENIRNARYFLWYILHFKLEMSPKSIGLIYMYDTRTVKYGYAKIRNSMKYHKMYVSVYEELMEKVKPLIPLNLDKFWGKA